MVVRSCQGDENIWTISPVFCEWFKDADFDITHQVDEFYLT